MLPHLHGRICVSLRRIGSTAVDGRKVDATPQTRTVLHCSRFAVWCRRVAWLSPRARGSPSCRWWETAIRGATRCAASRAERYSGCAGCCSYRRVHRAGRLCRSGRCSVRPRAHARAKRGGCRRHLRSGRMPRGGAAGRFRCRG